MQSLILFLLATDKGKFSFRGEAAQRRHRHRQRRHRRRHRRRRCRRRRRRCEPKKTGLTKVATTVMLLVHVDRFNKDGNACKNNFMTRQHA